LRAVEFGLIPYLCMRGLQPAVKTFQPFDATKLQALLAATADAAKHGHYERFKTDNPFDSAAKNPQWLG
jgi:hypothetical protein